MKKHKHILTFILALILSFNCMTFTSSAATNIVVAPDKNPAYGTTTAEGKTTTHDAILKQVGETGYFLRCPTMQKYCPYCKYTFTGTFAPILYCQINAQLSDSTVIGNISFDAGQWNSDSFNSECLRMNFTALKPGITTVTLTYYCNFYLAPNSGAGNYRCANCGKTVNVPEDYTWYRYTDTFTVQVYETSTLTLKKEFKGISADQIPSDFALDYTISSVTSDNNTLNQLNGTLDRTSASQEGTTLTWEINNVPFFGDGSGVVHKVELSEKNANVDGYNMVPSGDYPNFTLGQAWSGGTRTVTNTYTPIPKNFYVYHSSTGETETIPLTEGDEYNLTERVADGYLYGGLYTDDAFTEPYIDECGLSVYPEADQTYYLREVPNNYLDIQNLWIKNAKGELTASYLVTVVDGDYYQEAGFAYEEREDFPDDITDLTDSIASDIVYNSITVNETKNGKETSSTYTPTTVFVADGYFSIGKIDTNLNLIAVPYWVTQDGVKVTGCKARKIENGMKSDDKAYESSASLYGDISEPFSLLSIRSNYLMDGEEHSSEDNEITITKYDGSSSSTQSVARGDNSGAITYEEKEDCRFAGWFLDPEFTEAADFSDVSEDMTVYAKYVSNEYLTSKIQTVTSRNVITKLRTTVVVDAKQYAEVGFDYICGDEESNASIGTYRSTVSGKTADKFFGGTIPKTAKMLYNDLAVSKFADGTEITLTPYWITLDGTKVTGTSRTVIYHTNNIEVKENQ